MTKPKHQKSIIEAQYDKDWAPVGLGYSHIREFIKAIKTGNLGELKSFLDPKSSFNGIQKRALLTRCFNEKDFNHPLGNSSVTNAEKLAFKYQNKSVIEYLLKIKEQHPSPFAQKGIGMHSKNTSSKESEPSKNNQNKIKPQ